MRKGQALIIVMLIVGVVLTLGLSLANRSVTEVGVSTLQEESLRALEAAEAGVEQSLGGVIVGNSGSGVLPQTQASFVVSNTNLGGPLFETPYSIDPGDALNINLTDSSGGSVFRGDLRVCFKNNAAIEVALYYQRGSAYSVNRVGYDPVSLRTSRFAGGVSGTCSGGPAGYLSSVVISQPTLGVLASDIPQFMRIRPLYSSTPIALVSVSGSSIPPQAVEVLSTGQSGDARQKVRVVQANGDIPFMFDYAVFSGTSLTQ